MNELCSRYSLSYEFFDAIDGESLNNNEINKVYSEKKAIERIKRPLAKSEIACALSHKKIYEFMLDNNIEKALVLEDDVYFNQDLIEVIKKIDTLDVTWDVILLGHHSMNGRNIKTNSSIWGRKSIYKQYKLVRFCEIAAGAYGYLINIDGARKLYNMLDCVYQPIDFFTGDPNLINLYGVEPPVIKINENIDKIENSMQERKSLQNKYYGKSKKRKTFKRLMLEYLKILYKKVKPIKLVKNE